MQPAPPRTSRARRLAVLATAAVAGVGVVGLGFTGVEVATVAPAGAAGTTSTTQAAVELPGGGLSFRGGVVTAPGKPTRNLTAYQSAVFVQKWIVEALYGKPKHEPIPANVTPYRVDVTGTWGGGSDYTTRPVFYASDGTQAWVVFPDPTKVPASGIPAQLDWFVAPPQVISAFAGTGKLVPTASPGPAPTAGGAVPAADNTSGDDGGGSAWLWIAGVVAVVALGGFALGRRSSRARKR
jgi:hypothetical protein